MFRALGLRVMFVSCIEVQFIVLFFFCSFGGGCHAYHIKDKDPAAQVVLGKKGVSEESNKEPNLYFGYFSWDP